MAKPKRPADLKLTEQVESVAIAIAMALVLKFFIIEAYQIPSGSMQPTILGDQATGIKDRVIADKLVTMLRDPRRWEVMIFRFPSDERRLYVKRIVGLPGETLELKGGDIWIDGTIARKPDHVNESVLKEIFTRRGDGVDLGRWFTRSPGIGFDETRAVFAPDAGEPMRLNDIVRADFTHGYDPDWGIRGGTNGFQAVADLDVTLTLTLDPGARGLELQLAADDGDTVFFLPAAGSDLPARVSFAPTAGGSGSRVFLDDPSLSVPTGQAVEVVARSVDRRILLSVDGEEWLRHDDDLAGPRPDRPQRASVSLGLSGGGSVDDLIVRRDIFYERRGNPDPRWEIPDDSYFGLGDNTQASYDSRSWERCVYRKETDETIVGFWFPPSGPRPPPDANPVRLDSRTIRCADIHGDEHELARTSLEPDELQAAPFIHRRYLLGKVLAVFWPVFDPFRWKLVR